MHRYYQNSVVKEPSNFNKFSKLPKAKKVAKMTILWRSFILRAFFTILDYQEEDEYITLSLKSGASLHLLAETASWHEFRLFLRGQRTPRPFRHYPRVEETVPDVSTALWKFNPGEPDLESCSTAGQFHVHEPAWDPATDTCSTEGQPLSEKSGRERFPSWESDEDSASTHSISLSDIARARRRRPSDRPKIRDLFDEIRHTIGEEEHRALQAQWGEANWSD